MSDESSGVISRVEHLSRRGVIATSGVSPSQVARTADGASVSDAAPAPPKTPREIMEQARRQMAAGGGGSVARPAAPVSAPKPTAAPAPAPAPNPASTAPVSVQAPTPAPAQSSVAATPAQVAPSAVQAASTDIPAPAPRRLTPAPAPGVFRTPRQLLEETRAAEAAQAQAKAQVHNGRKEMAAVRVLARLLEAVYRQPGSLAPADQRIGALRDLVVNADAAGHVMATEFRLRESNSSEDYVRAQTMEMMVGLVGNAWERGETVDWSDVVSRIKADPLIMDAAERIGEAAYMPVVSAQTAAERISMSMHGACWSLYALGEKVDGLVPAVASGVVQSIASYLTARPRVIEDSDMYVAWVQGSIRRITDLFCADLVSKYANASAPTPEQIEEVLDVAKKGFEGVEVYASQLFEIGRNSAKPAVGDVPAAGPVG